MRLPGLVLWCAWLAPLASALDAAPALHVGPGRDFPTVRAALDACLPGGTVIVHPGTYREGNLVIDKPVTLLGEGWPRLDGEHRFEVVTITAPHVTVRGFELRDGGSGSLHDFAGIKVANTRGVTLEHNRILGSSVGIYFSKATDGVASGNEIIGDPAGRTDQGNGIHAWYCERLAIDGNRVARHRDGIYLEFVHDSTLTGNAVADCQRYGLHFMTAHRNRYRENEFLRNGAGVAVMYSREVRMEANRFLQSWGNAAYGLLLKEISDSRISGNTFERNSIAVTIQSSSRLEVLGNDFRGNGWALQIESSSASNTFRANNFIGNSFDVTSNGNLVDHQFEGNYWDRAELYDLDRDGVGDVPHRPLSLFAKLVDRVPASLLLLRSPLVHFLDRAERIFPTLTPDNLRDPRPRLRPLPR